MLKVLTIFSLTLLSSFGVYGDKVSDENLHDSIEPNLADPPEDENHFVNVGDMMLTREQYDLLYANDSLKRHGFHRAIQLWPRGIVPVVISEEFDPEYVELIQSAMREISDVSCVKFKIKRVPPAEHHVKIVKYNGCSSLVGRVVGGEQILRVGDYCKRGNVIHELLHLLGLLHMHTAALRDDYVRINWRNIHQNALKNFQRVTAYVSMFGTQYDYRSIMHYTSRAFAIDHNIPTIIPFERVRSMGQRERMSDGDITRLNRMYKCRKFKLDEEFDTMESEVGKLIDKKRSNAMKTVRDNWTKQLKKVSKDEEQGNDFHDESEPKRSLTRKELISCDP